MNTLLVSMPFGALERPALGLSLLKARLRSEEFPCDVRYLTFAFAEFIGCEEYQWVAYEMPYTAFAGDWLFTGALYGDRPQLDLEYVETILRRTWRLPQSDIDRLGRIRTFIPHFIDYCLAAVNWSQYDVVGFTSTFEQNIASLALAKRIKAQHPAIRVIFGGANWEGEMGEELHRQFPFVDYVCSGEAEQSLLDLIRCIREGTEDSASLSSVRGIVYRSAHTGSVATGAADVIKDLDSLPYPDFSDYFRGLEQCTVAAPVVPTLLFETSRGCWWGAKSHCTFCGLNGQTMAFRSKTPQRALDELEALVDQWRIEQVEAVDNILDMKYFNTLLPALAETQLGLQLFYEVKANLSKAQLKLLKQAGVHRIQPGIESLSDHVLKLMRKGTTALRNIQLLKWATELNITVEWNILYGFPGETADDYARMLDMLPSIRFLRPPCATGPIRLDRFSPYHMDPTAFGLRNVRPMATYSYLYPFPTASLQRIAYYFDFDYEPTTDPTGYASEVVAYASAWQRDPRRGSLTATVQRDDGTLTLLDTRPDATIQALSLSGLEQAAYEFCDELHAATAVTQHLRSKFPDTEFSDSQVRAFLDSLVANRLMVTDGVNYLSLAIQQQTSANERSPLSLAN